APPPGGARRLRCGTADGVDRLPSRCRHGTGGGTSSVRHADPPMTTLPGTVACPFHPRPRRRPSRPQQPGRVGRPPPVPAGRVPRVARLLALAIRLEQLVQARVIANYAALAQLGTCRAPA